MDSDNLITAGVILFSNILGCATTLLVVKLTKDIEYRLKKEEVNREKADDRIKNLYGPLIKLMSPQPPYDDLDLNFEKRRDVIKLIEKNEKYASPDLLKSFWEFRVVYYDGTKSQNGLSNIGFELYDKAYHEYEELKSILGYGSILKGPSSIKSAHKKITSLISSIVKKMKKGIWRIKSNSRRKRLLQKSERSR